MLTVIDTKTGKYLTQLPNFRYTWCTSKTNCVKLNLEQASLWIKVLSRFEKKDRYVSVKV